MPISGFQTLDSLGILSSSRTDQVELTCAKRKAPPERDLIVCTENQGFPYPVIVQYYRAAQTMISTSVPGVSVTPTAARAGGLSASIHAIQASFISSLRPRSAR